MVTHTSDITDNITRINDDMHHNINDIIASTLTT